jgi:hypothetical protein
MEDEFSLFDYSVKLNDMIQLMVRKPLAGPGSPLPPFYGGSSVLRRIWPILPFSLRKTEGLSPGPLSVL